VATKLYKELLALQTTAVKPLIHISSLIEIAYLVDNFS